MLFHIIVVFAAMYQLFSISNSLHIYSREQRLAFFRLFLDPELEVNDFFYDRNRAYYQVDELLESVQRGVDFYMN